MSNIFVKIYDWFDAHKRIFYIVLFLSVALCAAMASRITFKENIANFFKSSDGDKSSVFDNVAAKDRIVVMVSGDDPDAVVASAEVFEARIKPLIDSRLINSITATADNETIGKCTDFVYEYLPVFLTDGDYERFAATLDEKGIEEAVGNVYDVLTSPSGMVIGDIMMRDPLNIGTPLLREFEQFSPDVSYEIYDGRLFSGDLSTMLMFIEPANGMGDTGNNDRLVSALEEAEREAETDGVGIDCIGGPIVAVHNARQIKKDTAITMSLALIFILTVIFLSFRNRRSIPLIVIPPAFGAVFALAAVWLIQGEMSAIAMGAGTVVLGISLSYSIHIIAHLNHISSPREIIKELTMPLTIGCLTTIGAFAALIFTSSALLQDMGLFSVFALIGTTLFSLVFLPHFIGGFGTTEKSRLLLGIERIVGYRYDTNRWVIISVAVIFITSLFFYSDVSFDDDMSNINFVPEHIAEAEKRSAVITGDSGGEVYIVTGGSDFQTVADEYVSLGDMLALSVADGKVGKAVSAGDFVISPEVQAERIAKWEAFWSEHRESTEEYIRKAAGKFGFKDNAFSTFTHLLEKVYVPCGYSRDEIGDIPILSDWINASEAGISLMSRITIDDGHKDEVYREIESFGNTAVIDRGYFSSKMVESTSNDFNYILLVSSLIVFIALLLSYGRIELALLTFLPMCISWVIILGLMAVCGIKFNIVNIILATFIFGIGDDFSIFIMDGLLLEYKNGRKVLEAHKTAIFFSAFMAVVGMGVLIFARHPALKSIALISVLGLAVVVFVSYTVQPFLFRLLITEQTRKGNFPYTLTGIFNTLYCFLYFLTGCILSQLHILLLGCLPISRKKKKASFHRLIYGFSRFFLNTMVTVKTKRMNPYGEGYAKPAVIIANHQSFIDILLLLSTSPKIIMVTNSWVWKSPFFGWIVRYADFYHSADGYENLAERVRRKMDEGYSVVIFPEGTRSADCTVRRFHKGAFYLASLLKADILPVILYGTGQISAKTQPFYIKKGVVAAKTMKRIPYGDPAFGESYQEQAKRFRQWYREQYNIFCNEAGGVNDPYFKDCLIKNYIYKGPVLEWYMKVKCRIDGYYDLWDKLIPRDAAVTDVGCGYGQMSFRLGLLSPQRKITAMDYDPEKISLAAHSFLAKKTGIRFLCADMRECAFPESDAILFNDSLHYVSREAQEKILTKAFGALKKGGLIIVRDGDSSLSEEQKKIDRTEKWSTELIRFNKTSERLCFVDAAWMKEFAEKHDMEMKIRRCDKDSSETLYILRMGPQKGDFCVTLDLK